MMEAHKLGGKQKAMLISSSIRNAGWKKKINVCQIEKVKMRRERNFDFKILRRYCQHWKHGKVLFPLSLLLIVEFLKSSLVYVFSDQICEMMESELHALSPGKGNDAAFGVWPQGSSSELSALLSLKNFLSTSNTVYGLSIMQNYYSFADSTTSLASDMKLA